LLQKNKSQKLIQLELLLKLNLTIWKSYLKFIPLQKKKILITATDIFALSVQFEKTAFKSISDINTKTTCTEFLRPNESGVAKIKNT
jgi:hypothetical protein